MCVSQVSCTFHRKTREKGEVSQNLLARIEGLFVLFSRDTDSIVYPTILLLSFIKRLSFLVIVGRVIFFSHYRTRYRQNLCS